RERALADLVLPGRKPQPPGHRAPDVLHRVLEPPRPPRDHHAERLAALLQRDLDVEVEARGGGDGPHPGTARMLPDADRHSPAPHGHLALAAAVGEHRAPREGHHRVLDGLLPGLAVHHVDAVDPGVVDRRGPEPDDAPRRDDAPVLATLSPPPPRTSTSRSPLRSGTTPPRAKGTTASSTVSSPVSRSST